MRRYSKRYGSQRDVFDQNKSQMLDYKQNSDDGDTLRRAVSPQVATQLLQDSMDQTESVSLIGYSDYL